MVICVGFGVSYIVSVVSEKDIVVIMKMWLVVSIMVWFCIVCVSELVVCLVFMFEVIMVLIVLLL